MKACILVAVRASPATVARALRKLQGVLDAFPVQDRHEVIVRADLRGMAHLADLVDGISATTGVVVSETLLEIPQVVRR